MDVSGEVADLMVKESIQITEESVKLLAAGAKNLTAFLLALAQDNKKLSGKTNMARLLREGKELKVFSIRESDLPDFRHFAKKNVLTAEQICEHAWGMEGSYNRGIAQPIRLLRQAIEPDPEHPIYIETVRRVGYRFTAYKRI